MKTLIVYDTTYGNTEQLARAIADAINGETDIKRAAEANPVDVEGVGLLIVGSPTIAGKPTSAIQHFLKSLSGPFSAAAFDTRMTVKWARIFGYAADRIAKTFQKTGGTLVAPPEAFYVADKEGPLVGGEAQRAADWARKIAHGNPQEG